MSKMEDILNTSDILATELKCSFMTSKSLSTEPNALGLIRIKLKPEVRARFFTYGKKFPKVQKD